MNSASLVRLCCGQPHFGATCSDGKVMCCICFNRFEVADLNFAIDPDFSGQHEDVCLTCAEEE